MRNRQLYQELGPVWDQNLETSSSAFHEPALSTIVKYLPLKVSSVNLFSQNTLMAHI